MPEHSRLISISVKNIGCIGSTGLTVELSRIVCLVGANNAGKTTVLRAYELAVNNLALADGERCKHSPTHEDSTIEMVMHIPEGTPNIGEEWIEKKDGRRLLTSRWSWSPFGGKPKRQTYHPVQKWAADEKAAGLDAVFAARLPKPLRVGSLDGPEVIESALVRLVIEPIVNELKRRQEGDPELTARLSATFEAANKLVKELRKDIEEVEKDLNERLSTVFPSVPVGINATLGEASLDFGSLLSANTALRTRDNGADIPSSRQGTGTQRALFWSLLAVKAGLDRAFSARSMEEAATKRRKDAGAKYETLVAKAEAAVKKAEDALGVAEGELAQCMSEPKKKKKAEDKLAKKKEALDEAKEEVARVKGEQDAHAAAPVEKVVVESAYMLLIDEPETALHPGAIRAARDCLYELAKEDGWQIILTTHSPVFVDPTADHTTIVRLEREKNTTTPRTFKSDAAEFVGDDREQLKQLMHFDTGLAEMFFGGYPIVVEGDTEFAAFSECLRLNSALVQSERRPVFIRARGKDAIRLVVRVLRHFKVGFSVLHDADTPRTKKGKPNVAWSANARIYEELVKAHLNEEVAVVHRVSIPDFERHHLLKGGGKDKPWKTWSAVRSNTEVRNSIAAVLKGLLPSGTRFTPVEVPPERKGSHTPAKEFLEFSVGPQVLQWAKANKKDGNLEFDFAPPKAEETHADEGEGD